ncbi:MAG: hypothetical protein N2423_01705 [Novosphingobium sp.]|nr:hypothetical protein [Novosphingobium sp.]
MASIDAALCVLAVFVAFSLRVGAFEYPLQPMLVFLAVALPSFLPVFHVAGIYKSMLRFLGVRSIRELAFAMMAYTLLLTIPFMAIGVPGVPRTVAILHPIIFFGFAVTFRMVARQLLAELGMVHNAAGKVRRAMIYGAGLEGQQLAMQLRHEPQFRLCGFIDDDEGLFGHKVDGLLIHPSSRLLEVLSAQDIDILFIAAPALTR